MSIGSPAFAMNIAQSKAKADSKAKGTLNQSNQSGQLDPFGQLLGQIGQVAKVAQLAQVGKAEQGGQAGQANKSSNLFQLLAEQLQTKSSAPVSHRAIHDVKQQGATNNEYSATANTDVNQQLLMLIQILQQLQQSVTNQQVSHSGQNQTDTGSVTKQLNGLQNLLGQLTSEFQNGSLQSNRSKATPLNSANVLNDWNQLSASIQNSIESGALSTDTNNKINQVLQSMRAWMSFDKENQHSNIDTMALRNQQDVPAFAQSSIGNHLLHTMDSGTNTTPTSGGAQQQDSQAGVEPGAPLLVANSSFVQTLTGSKPVDATIPAQSFAQQFGKLLDSSGITGDSGFLQTNFGEKEFRIKLVPEGLGEIHVVIQAKDAGLSVQFAASSDQARQMLDAQSMQLRDQLSSRGFQLDQVQVTDLPSSLSFAFSQSDQQGRNGGQSQQKSQKQGGLELDPLEPTYSSYLDRSLVSSDPLGTDGTATIDTTA